MSSKLTSVYTSDFSCLHFARFASEFRPLEWFESCFLK